MSKGLRSKRVKRNKSVLRKNVVEKIVSERLSQVVDHEKERNRFDIQMATDPSPDTMEVGTVSSGKSFNKKSRKAKSATFNAYGINKSELKF